MALRRPHNRLQWLTPASFTGFCGLLTVAGLLLLSARSPLALPLADAAAGAGYPGLAVERYDAIANSSPWVDQQQDALWRAGNVLDVSLQDSTGSRTRFRRLSVMEDSPYRARALDRVGRILRHREHRPEAAAIALTDSWKADPLAAEAPDRLRRAAAAFEEAGEITAALDALESLEIGYPSARGRAQLSRGVLLLAQDDEAAALAAYRDALEGDDPSVHAAARLGSATCLERLGNLDEALAELDAADLPEDVFDARAGSIRARILTDELVDE